MKINSNKRVFTFFSKKGEMTSKEVASIVLSVISIVILILLAKGLYGIFTQQSKFRQATTTMDGIATTIEYMKKNNVPDKDFLITGPKDWVLAGFQNQLCICPNYKEGKEQECIRDGACKLIEVRAYFFPPPPSNILSKFVFSVKGEEWDPWARDYLELSNLPFSLKIEIKNGAVELSENK